MNTHSADVLIIGAGPSGLAAAIELKRLGVDHVIAADREQQAGGIPRHSDHIGFGTRDLHRFISGPAYAARYVRMAQQAGVELYTETTITGWESPDHLLATSPQGRTNLEAKAVLLATGCRERPRAARMISGSRPQGVMTTGMLQNFVYVKHQAVGKRAVVVGADHVGFSAILTLKHSGAEVAALVTDLAQHQSYFQYKLISADRYRVPVYTNVRVTRIIGQKRVEAVELTDVRDGSVRQIECDTVVFTGDWIPDYELAFYGGAALDPHSKSPAVNGRLQTSIRGVFAAGNLIHAAETADVAALSGRYAARQIADYLRGGSWASQSLPIQIDEALAWISPAVIDPGDLNVPHGHFILRAARLIDNATLEVWQADRCLLRRWYGKLVPNLPIYLPERWLESINAGDPIRVEVHAYHH
ncbi:MAG TPA: FAD-dependent oxidoreductase [Phototrophicaceae bacterium]|nr:FAD-dependent oxidoreductase [Phototrophicaceae bacterium]